MTSPSDRPARVEKEADQERRLSIEEIKRNKREARKVKRGQFWNQFFKKALHQVLAVILNAETK